MSDPIKPVAPAPAVAPNPAPGATILVRMNRDYWPKTRPAGWPDDQEYRVRAEDPPVELPVEEAMDVVEAGIGTRVKREDILKG